VVLYHLSVVYPPPSHADEVEHLLWGGTTGVSFFFVLSGFVLAWSADESARPMPFYRRRFARVYPTHALTWALAVGWLTWQLGEPATWLGKSLGALVLVHAWHPDREIIFAANAVSWTLACELFFYLLFPWLFPAIDRWSQRWKLLPALWMAPGLILIAVRLAEAGDTWIAFFPPSRLPEFVFGIVIACEVRDRRWPRIWLPLAATLAFCSFLAAGVWQEFRYSSVIPMVPYGVLIGAVAQADLSQRAPLNRRWLVRLGVWSYALYMVHWVWLMVAQELVHPSSNLAVAGTWAAMTGIVVASAALIHRWWEAPWERRLRSPRAALGDGPRVDDRPEARAS
jgi:peptidoglycan/LPS O-acetylase OafA/YrhL